MTEVSGPLEATHVYEGEGGVEDLQEGEPTSPLHQHHLEDGDPTSPLHQHHVIEEGEPHSQTSHLEEENSQTSHLHQHEMGGEIEKPCCGEDMDDSESEYSEEEEEEEGYGDHHHHTIKLEPRKPPPDIKNEHVGGGQCYVKKIRTVKKVFRCSLCDFFSFNRDNTEQHIKIHNEPQNTKLYYCSTCKYSTRVKPYFDKHRKLHSNTIVRPFKCSYCPYQGRFRSHTRAHEMRHHTGEKPFVCSLCDRGFVEQHMLDCAIRHQNFRGMKTLLEHGDLFDIKQRDRDGRSLLHLSIVHAPNQDIIVYLLEHGLSPSNDTDNKGNTPLIYFFKQPRIIPHLPVEPHPNLNI